MSEIDIKNIIKNIVYEKFKAKYDFTYHNQIYTLEEILDGIIYILETGIPYNKYMGKISGKTLNKHLLFLRDNNIFKLAYQQLLNKYYLSQCTCKLKFQLLDTSHINNEYCTDNLGRNPYYKNKKGFKISLLTDKDGITFSPLIKPSNISDSKIVEEHFNNLLINPNTFKYKNHNRYKQYLLADKGYDSKEIRNLLENKGYIPIIPYNKRNTKDKKKIKHLTVKEKKIYKKRIKIENLNSWIKKNRRLSNIYDKSCQTYTSYLFLGLLKILVRKMNNFLN